MKYILLFHLNSKNSVVCLVFGYILLEFYVHTWVSVSRKLHSINIVLGNSLPLSLYGLYGDRVY